MADADEEDAEARFHRQILTLVRSVMGVYGHGKARLKTDCKSNKKKVVELKEVIF
jgi:hypothetical protein